MQYRRPTLPSVFGYTLALVVSSLFGKSAIACRELPAGTRLRIRLQAPVSSYSTKPGRLLRAVLTEPISCDSSSRIPAGMGVEGMVASVTKVGMGFRHEAASLELDFNRLIFPLSESLFIRTKVLEVDNARETVKQGVIHGVRLSSVPQGLISSRLIHLPSLNPYSDLALLIFKTTFPVFPDPEINLPAGTDLVLELVGTLSLPEDLPPPPSSSLESMEDAAALDQLVASLPSRTTALDGTTPADIVNLLFAGSLDQLVAAFSTAGWTAADPLSIKSVYHNLYAVLAATANPRAPVSTLLLEGVRPFMIRQKVLNSYAKRHHIRIWKWPGNWQGQPLWLAAATHDVGISISPMRMSFRHQINPDIDEERSRIVQDLSLAGFVDSVYLPGRPGIPQTSRNATGSTIHTDGAMAVVRLREPAVSDPPTTVTGPIPDPGPRHWTTRLLRREVLMLRSDYLRANILYGGYDFSRYLLSSRAHSRRYTGSLD